MGGGNPSQDFVPTQTMVDPSVAPSRDFALSEARRMYDLGGPKYFEGQNYISPSQVTQNALAMAEQRAMAGSPLNKQAQQTVMSQMGYSSPYAGKIEALGQSAYDPSASFYRSMMEGQPESEAARLTRSTASGAYLDGASPFLQGALSQANRLAGESFAENMKGLQAQAAAAGRYGSGAMAQQTAKSQDVLARALAEQNQQAYLQNYQAERAAQEAAMGRLGSLEQQAIANRFSGASGLTAGQQNALNTQLAALGASQRISSEDLDRQMQAATLAPQMAAQDFADMQRLLAVGQAREGYDAAKLQGDMARFNYNEQLPYQMLQQYGSFISGLPMGSITDKYERPKTTSSSGLNSNSRTDTWSYGNPTGSF